MLEQPTGRDGFQGEVVTGIKYSRRASKYENRQRETRLPLIVKTPEMEEGEDTVLKKCQV